jgi:hypothetical protein
MQQQVKEAPIDAEAGQLKRAEAGEVVPRRRDAAALWRAMAGMAISLALAFLIVMLELTGRATYRADRAHRHADALRSRISRLESEVADERARIATAHRELAAAEELRAILRAPDAGMLPLAPPSVPRATAAPGATAAPRSSRSAIAPGAAAADAPGAGVSRRPQATLALAPREHRAVLIVAGLKSGADDTLFVLWWSAARGAAVRAAEFRTAADGSALVMAALPAGLDVAAAIVTAEHGAESGAAANAGAASAPAAAMGRILLRGTLTR